MKDRASKTKSNSARRNSWRTAVGVAAVMLLLVGIVAAITKEEIITLKAETPNAQADTAKRAAGSQARHYVTSNASGQNVVVDRQTGQSRVLTPQEAQNLAEGIKQLIKPTADGLVQVHHANGMVSMDLQGHFQNVSVAKREDDGSITQSCVNDLESAAEFFEIDPALLGISAPVSKADGAPSQPAIR